MTINFDSITQEAIFLSPANNFEPDRQVIEKRLDPLTKHSSTLLPTMTERGVKFTLKMDKDEVDRISEKSRKGCFMCPELVYKTTPKFASEILPEGRLRVGQVVLFPNILALARHTAVLTIPEQHFLALDELTPDLLRDCLRAAIEFIKRVYIADSETAHAVIGCNYMFPAGASTVHTHFHIFLDSTPFDLVSGLLVESQRYHLANSANYWADLVEAEKGRGERYITSIGNTEWLTPFAPGGDYDVRALVRGKSSFLQFDDRDIADLASGLSRVLKLYHSRDLYSFNLLVYSGPLGSELDYFWAGLKIVCRGYHPPYYTSDVTWRQRLLSRNEIWMESPEKVASMLKDGFLADRTK